MGYEHPSLLLFNWDASLLPLLGLEMHHELFDGSELASVPVVLRLRHQLVVHDLELHCGFTELVKSTVHPLEGDGRASGIVELFQPPIHRVILGHHLVLLCGLQDGGIRVTAPSPHGARDQRCSACIDQGAATPGDTSPTSMRTHFRWMAVELFERTHELGPVDGTRVGVVHFYELLIIQKPVSKVLVVSVVEVRLDLSLGDLATVPVGIRNWILVRRVRRVLPDRHDEDTKNRINVNP